MLRSPEPRGARAAGVPSALLRDAPVHRLREARGDDAAGLEREERRRRRRPRACRRRGRRGRARSPPRRGRSCATPVPTSGSRTTPSPSTRARARTSSSRSAFRRSGGDEPAALVARERIRQAQERTQRRLHEAARSRRATTPDCPGGRTRASSRGRRTTPACPGGRRPPEDLLDAELGLDPTDEVVRPDGDAARGDEHVRLEAELDRRRGARPRRRRPPAGARPPRPSRRAPRRA